MEGFPASVLELSPTLAKGTTRLFHRPPPANVIPSDRVSPAANFPNCVRPSRRYQQATDPSREQSRLGNQREWTDPSLLPR